MELPTENLLVMPLNSLEMLVTDLSTKILSTVVPLVILPVIWNYNPDRDPSFFPHFFSFTRLSLSLSRFPFSPPSPLCLVLSSHRPTTPMLVISDPPRRQHLSLLTLSLISLSSLPDLLQSCPTKLLGCHKSFSLLNFICEHLGLPRILFPLLLDFRV